jgi:hypothetical protein
MKMLGMTDRLSGRSREAGRKGFEGNQPKTMRLKPTEYQLLAISAG